MFYMEIMVISSLWSMQNANNSIRGKNKFMKLSSKQICHVVAATMMMIMRLRSRRPFKTLGYKPDLSILS